MTSVQKLAAGPEEEEEQPGRTRLSLSLLSLPEEESCQSRRNRLSGVNDKSLTFPVV